MAGTGGRAMLHGRIGRLPYALGVSLLGMAAVLTFCVGFTVAWGFDSPRSGYVAWIVSVGLLAVPPLPLHVRRLHDAGLSGWWLLVPAALTGVLVTVGMGRPGDLNLGDWACWLVLIPYGLTYVAGFAWPGHQGGNRYGTAPNRPNLLIIVSGAAAAGLYLLLAVTTAAAFLR
ncbi:MAG: DUF805 domain-containing protein [Chloroflexi bacterium]|nr:DUF805 domain-containing protein [Chloroflexota bacterium]